MREERVSELEARSPHSPPWGTISWYLQNSTAFISFQASFTSRVCELSKSRDFILLVVVAPEPGAHRPFGC